MFDAAEIQIIGLCAIIGVLAIGHAYQGASYLWRKIYNPVVSLDQNQWLAVQTALRAKEIGPAVMDGIPGPHTREALSDFQKLVGEKPTGESRLRTLQKLGVK